MTAPLPTPLAGQAEILQAWDSPTLVVGAAGTGKTVLCGWASVTAEQSGRNPLVIAGGRLAASALRNRIAVTLGGSSQVRVTTIHAVARRILERFSGAEVHLLTAPEQEFRVRELLASAGAQQRWPAQWQAALPTAGFARQVRAALARARQLGMDPQDVRTAGVAAGDTGWVALGEFFEEYLDVLDAEGVLDYAEAVHRARILLADPAVAEAFAADHQALVIDDLPELDPAQLGLLRSLSTATTAVLACADPQNRLLAFRGAHPHALRAFREIFHDSAGQPAVLRTLTESVRLGGEIHQATELLRARLPVQPGFVNPSTSAPTESSIMAFAAGSESGEAALIADTLCRHHLAGLPWREMAVILRSPSRQQAVLIRALNRAGVPVQVAPDEIVLAESPAVRPFVVLLEVALAGRVRPGQAEALLTSGLGGLDSTALRQLVRLWWQAYPHHNGRQSSSEVMAVALGDPAVELPRFGDLSEPVRRVWQRLQLIREVVLAAIADCAAGREVPDLLWRAWQKSAWGSRLVALAERGGALGRRAEQDLAALAALFSLAGDFSAGAGARGVRAFIAAVMSQQIPADRERESLAGADGVEILSVHRARGRQWQLVVIPGLQEGIWPAVRPVARLLDADRLSMAGLAEPADPRDHLNSERGQFLAACSRASGDLVLTTAAGQTETELRESRYLAELGVAVQTPPNGAPLRLSDLVVLLRREAADAGRATARRAAAAQVLARLSGETGADGVGLVPSADPESWWGVRAISSVTQPQPNEAEIRLSPSQVGALLECPRRYFLAREAKANPVAGTAATIGSLVHLLVQRANGDPDLDLGAAQEQLIELWPTLDFESSWLAEAERDQALLCVERFFAWRELRQGRPLAVEQPFDVRLELAGLKVRLVGAVDWLEVDQSGALRVVDFKTGRAVPTKAAAAKLDQLGIYQLAVEAGGFEALAPGSARCGGAEVVYLRRGAAGNPNQPTVLSQPALCDRPLLEDEPEHDQPTWAHQRVVEAARILSARQFPATPGDQCSGCRFADSCPALVRGGQVA